MSKLRQTYKIETWQNIIKSQNWSILTNFCATMLLWNVTYEKLFWVKQIYIVFLYMMIVQSFLNYLNHLHHCKYERIANETLSIKLISISFAVLRENYLNLKWRWKALINLGIPLMLQIFNCLGPEMQLVWKISAAFLHQDLKLNLNNKSFFS